MPLKVISMSLFNHQSGKYFAIKGANIYYEETGNPNNSVLLLLHGGFQHIEDLNSLVPLLANEFRVLGIDSRGHGKSTLGTAPLTYEQIQLDVEALLESLQIKRVTVIGFSDGGIVGYRLAASHAIAVEKLVTIGGTWHFKDALATEDLFRKITPQSWKEKFPQTYEDYSKLNPTPAFDQLIQSGVAMWLDSTATGYPNQTVSQIDCPTLLIRGDQDHLFSRESVVELAGKIKNSALFNVPFAGHVAFEDQPELFKTALAQFLKAESGERSPSD
jgi:pimeloyl-ACP methyl ester carboxylesterase